MVLCRLQQNFTGHDHCLGLIKVARNALVDCGHTGRVQDWQGDQIGTGKAGPGVQQHVFCQVQRVSRCVKAVPDRLGHHGLVKGQLVGGMKRHVISNGITQVSLK